MRYNHDNIYQQDGKWFRVCPKCNSHLEHSTRNAALTTNRTSAGCNKCYVRNKTKQKPIPPKGLTGGVFIFNKKWYRMCRNCHKILMYGSAKTNAYESDSMYDGCYHCNKPKVIKLDELQIVNSSNHIRQRAKEFFDRLDIQNYGRTFNK